MIEKFIVFGGGCFGTHHVGSIEKGRVRGRIDPDVRIIVLDHNERPPMMDNPEVADNPHVTFVQTDWLDYMKANWDTLDPDVQVVPAPIAPHLASDWLTWSLRERLGGPDTVEVLPMAHEFGGLPYEHLAPHGARYISAADWVCPIYCRAPHICPMTRSERTWELSRTVNEFAEAHPDTVAAAAVFEPRFRVPGIDALRIREYTEARDRLFDIASRPESMGKEIVVATVSPCHGAVSLLRIAAPVPAGLLPL